MVAGELAGVGEEGRLRLAVVELANGGGGGGARRPRLASAAAEAHEQPAAVDAGEPSAKLLFLVTPATGNSPQRLRRARPTCSRFCMARYSFWAGLVTGFRPVVNWPFHLAPSYSICKMLRSHLKCTGSKLVPGGVFAQY